MFATVLLLLAGAFVVKAAICPRPEFVYPCTCRPWDSGIFVVCYQVNDTVRLRSVFQLLRDYEITRLLLKDVHLLETSGPSVFSGMHIKLLRLIDSRLTRTDPSTRRQGPIAALSPYLERLDLTHCQGSFHVGQIAFGTLSKLRDLNVVRDSFDTLRRNWLPNPSNVTNLRMEQCSISDIESRALSHMTSLRSLTLSKNELTRFRREVLPLNCAELLSIDLSENRIQTLQRSFFQGMPMLHTVNLYGNRLQTLDEATWTRMWSQLDKLWISQNSIICDESLSWICDEEKRKPPLLDGTCSAPERLRGMALASLRADDLPVQDRD